MVCGPGGRRSIKCAEFTTGVFETKLAADEIIESVRIPRLSADARWGYLKLCRKSGEFASALAVVVADPYARPFTRRPRRGQWRPAGARRNFAARLRGWPRRNCAVPWLPISIARRTGISTSSSAIFMPSPQCAQCDRCCSDCDPLADQRRRRRGRRAAAIVIGRFSARAPQSDRHPSRLRARRLRRLHGPRRRRAGALVPDARRRLRRARGHDDRGLRRRSGHRGAAPQFSSASRIAMRVLHAGNADHRARSDPAATRGVGA